ncbi:hypothetical protein KCG43_06265, partial [Photobacterium sp. WH24]|uniref:hypothetical protein n=1 Tax=Photobacterium sp. WH24 TaxID=2827237 RepID=UPI001C43D899
RFISDQRQNPTALLSIIRYPAFSVMNNLVGQSINAGKIKANNPSLLIKGLCNKIATEPG